MTDPAKPGWPEAGAFPFMPFPVPGAGGAAPPLLQGLAGSMDLIKDFWSRLPGGAALPGFMVPTVDVDELDRRIGDLRAAERWVEVNLGMLRTTIQGLEVQRHTIAALQSLTTPTASGTETRSPTSTLPPGWPAPPVPEAAAPAAASAPPAPAPASADWLAYLQAQFAKVAQAAITPETTLATAHDATEPRRPSKKAATRARKATAR